ncbi:MAG TPA: DegT/DnrJ/EryC1/StrS family aminotransferase [Actinocrinis sp.]|uniref:DegT/DnrJ/EryC1/StrS family aminotransferase n=1 Tax=Actinocrinis sp. TaxID=1920516 RepID=UPI002D660A97|nr:DegT/DnrJ/EryC1/StrS family aminotransferase [Actinocrinis sp.]HZU55675.1 DegT/DnrJ/EryC1/StrS family aminotransferase [Actinocrinis sp.]
MQTGAISPAYARNAKPYLLGGELDAVAAVFEDGEFGHAKIVEQFERAVAAFLGVDDVVAVASGTEALYIALRAAGISPGCEVIVPSLTFCASVQAIVATGARPVFVEVDPATLCTCAQTLLDAVTSATRAVMPVLYGGRAIDCSSIRAILHERDIVIIEDAAHAFGSTTPDGEVPVGATGDVTCFSFGPIKNLTCGQGGAIVPRSAHEAERARTLRLWGVATSQAERKRTTGYQVQGTGLHGFMSAINAAIGLVQLDGFAALRERRTSLWRAYRDVLAPLEQVALVDVDIERSVPFNCVVRVPERDAVFTAMRGAGLGVGVHYPPNHRQPAFDAWARGLPVTEKVSEQIMSLPFHPAMDADDAQIVAAALAQALPSARGRG